MKFTFCFGLLCFVIITSCNHEKKTIPQPNNKYLASNIAALPLDVKHPKNNIPNNIKIKLGKLLFYDPILSGDKDVACATCHHPSNGYAEFRDISIGVNGKGFASNRTFNKPNTIPFLKRNAHTIINTAFNGIDTLNRYIPENAPMFWDSRVNSLELQALEPIKSLEEMRGLHFSDTEILKEVVSRLQNIKRYRSLFFDAFQEKNAITPLNIGKAIAAFERTLLTNNSNFDKYMRGDSTAISLAEKKALSSLKRLVV